MKLSKLFRTDTPWSSGGLEAARRVAPVRAAVVGLMRSSSPGSDEVLSSRGVKASSVQSWISDGHRGDGAFREAGNQGTATASLSSVGMELERGKGGEALWARSPETLDGGHSWCGLFVRKEGAFSEQERAGLSALVRLWQSQFNNPDEFGLSMMLVGSDRRLIHADPACRLRWLLSGVTAESLIEEIGEVQTQRWPDNGAAKAGSAGASHDAVLQVGEDAMWVRFMSRRALGGEDATHMIVELRPMETEELPAVGVLEDRRVARALGYLHDHYNEGPTLSDLAAEVDVSPFHFHRVFTRHVGVSPKQYQLLKQLQVARWRLRAGREPIGTIADKVGFANHAHFTSTFRRMLGVSPSEYQRRFASVVEGGESGRE